MLDGGADRVRASADLDLIEDDVEAALPLDVAGLVHGADDAAHHRAGRHEHATALHQVDHRRRLEAILDLRGVRAERVLQPHIELGSGRHFIGVGRTGAGARWPGAVAICVGRRRRVAARRVAARDFLTRIHRETASRSRWGRRRA